ncbi:MAG: CHASE sensor domain-containing protein [Syntrophotaleaceae bacterium]
MKLPTPDIRNWSIKNKLKAVIILTSLAVLLVLFLVFVVTQRSFLRSSLLQEMTILSHNIANNCAASVIFGDRRTAGETLESLRANPQVIAGVIFDTEGQVFSSYFKQPQDSASMISPPALPPDDGHLFSAATWMSSKASATAGNISGILHLRADLSKIEATLLRYIGFGFAGLGGVYSRLVTGGPPAECHFSADRTVGERHACGIEGAQLQTTGEDGTSRRTRQPDRRF